MSKKQKVGVGRAAHWAVDFDANLPWKMRSDGTPKAAPNCSVASRMRFSRSDRAVGCMALFTTDCPLGTVKSEGGTSGGTLEVRP